ncbi:MAG: AMIN domain-containing protein [Desulfuromonadaceae bacterium]|nr:AMIN domain-containing protein [Desulfuromonadaceae bacterium]
MKPTLTALMSFMLLCCMNSAIFAAELLDVKPVVSGSAVSIEISADIAMTYTFYKIPGQARAVVDIAEADPEKVEPLIVVNKGAVSSISVDKTQISGLVVSRIIFNLVSESDISVSASPDRKLLTVTFGGSNASAVAKPETKQESKEILTPGPEVQAAPPATPLTAATPEEDPLGLDEPAAKATATGAKAAVVAGATATASSTAAEVPLQAAPTVIRIPKLEPVVPVVTAAPTPPAALTVQEITTGADFIEIRTSQSIADYKATRISGPDRLIIDIPAEKVGQKAKTITINKFGITKARIGVSQKNIRIVLDSKHAGFPAHTISKTEDGVRIRFK